VGNSHASIFVPGNSIYGNTGMSPQPVTTSDNAWLINDALFDRYYLSGIAPEFQITLSGYQQTGSITKSLKNFYGVKVTSPKKTSPALMPYVPNGKTADEIVTELTPILNPDGSYLNDDSYKKLGAYSMIKGALNVNSTSVKAWEALLRANRNLAVTMTDNNDPAGTTDALLGTPFPGLKKPVMDSGAVKPLVNGEPVSAWDGFARLTDAHITSLATNIVDQVKARGPFMSLSDFVNRQVSNNTALNKSGALQAAIDQALNFVTNDAGGAIEAEGTLHALKRQAGGLIPQDPEINGWQGVPILMGDADMTNRLTTEGIAGDIRQADILRALAPRLSARTDTFRIRAYGEVTDADGNVIAKAMCEAVVQRLPEYVDTETSPNNNEPWDDGATLNAINQTYGRRFEIRSFRWLDDSEV
jgi:hypothetical protein